jgi:hypothetical protein
MAKDRVLNGGGYWMIPAPQNYNGKIYSTGLIYEHRYILEQKLGRYLTSDEIAHHINKNKQDNRPENIEFKTTTQHNVFHGNEKGKSIVILKCPSCDSIFERPKSKTNTQKEGKFSACSSSCRGKFSRKIQLEGLTEEIKLKFKNNFIKEYKKFSQGHSFETPSFKKIVNQANLKKLGLHIKGNYSEYSKIPSRKKILCKVRCPQCKRVKLISKNKINKFKHCSKKCADLSRRKVIRPTKEKLKELLKTQSYLAVGRLFGVSDNAIRKWLKN